MSDPFAPARGALAMPTRRAVLTGAGALLGSAAVGTRRARAAGKTQLKIMSWEQFQPGEKDGWNELLTKYNDSQSKVEVSWTGWPFDQFVQNVVTQMHAGGIDADILMATPDLGAEVVRKFKMAVPLDPVVDALKITPTTGHNFLRLDGKLYGLSVIDMRFSLVYDQTLYDKAGIKAPPRTPEEWVEVTRKTTHRPNQFGMYLPNTMADAEWWWGTMQSFVLPYGGTWAEGNKPLLTSLPVVQGLKLWKDLYDAGVPKGTGTGAALRLVADQRIAQTWDVIAFMIVVKSVSPKSYAAHTSAPPPWPNRKALDRLHPIIVLNTGKNIDAATDFAKFAMAPENIGPLMAKNLYIIPPYSDLGERSPVFGEFLASVPWSKGYLSADPVAPADIMGDFAYVDDQFGRIVVQNLQRTMVSGTSIEEAMATAQKQLEALAMHL
jgi:ABC-type glycerol-3-phosphate transport system substrate-binding protein